MKITASRIIITACLMPWLVLSPSLNANPNGANVVAGNVTFGASGSTLNINQSSQNAIINWRDFSNRPGETFQFNQPANGLTINRVTSGNVSQIFGNLKANGDVLVINPAGVVVGSSGVIDVGGALTLSTRNASNRDLLNGGATRFRGSGGTITNRGTIRGEDITIMADQVNNRGSLNASRSLAVSTGNDITVRRTEQGAAISVNSGPTSRGSVGIGSHGNTYALAINNSGTRSIRANSFKLNGGKLTLSSRSSISSREVALPPPGPGAPPNQPIPPVPAGPEPVVPLNLQSLGPQFAGLQKWEAFDQPYLLLDYDGYDQPLFNLSPSDIVVDGTNQVSGLEKSLDYLLGPRKLTWTPKNYPPGGTNPISLNPNDAVLEDIENQERIHASVMRGVGNSESSYYLYHPSTNEYSSYRLFGYPAADVPAFAPGQ